MSRRCRTRLAFPVAACALALLLAGCTRQNDDLLAESADTLGAPSSQQPMNPADVQHPSPPQPTGLQIGRSDRLMNGWSTQLEEWTAMWRKALPGFQVDSTWGVRPQRWTPARRSVEGDFERRQATDLTLQLLGIESPDGRYVLDVDAYQEVVVVGDSVEVGGEPDSQPVLIDRGANVEYPLQFCGTSCGFHWGRWLSTTQFALGGWQQADDYGQWMQGSLAIYSTRDSIVRTYETRIVPARAFARYQAAWKRWLLRRYHVVQGPA